MTLMFEKRVLYFLVFLGIILYGVFLSQTNQGFLGETLQASSNIIGKPAPDFEVVSEKGERLALKSLKGKVVFLHFWATWCPPCAAEFSTIGKFVAQFTNKDFVIVAISLDESKNSVKEFRKTTKFDFPVYFDPEEGHIADIYGTFRLPETYFINKEGIVVRKISGPQNWLDPIWLTRINELLK